MKKNILAATALAAVVALASCNNSTPQNDTQSANAETPAGGIKIAYIEVDSLMSQYNFCKEFTIELQKKSTNARNTLNSKGQQLQKAVQNFQQKLQSNGFSSREEAERVQAAIQRQEADLNELQGRLAAELDTETAKYNTALRDSLKGFLDAYNKDKKYDMILSKAGDNILLADERFDITQDVINGLNKRYKSTFKKEEKK